MDKKKLDNIDDDINLYDLMLLVWKKKVLVIFVTSIFAIFSVFYSLSLPNIYTSSAIYAPTNQEDSLSSKLGGYSSLAGLAGISLPSDAGNKSKEAIARMQSYDFFVDKFLPFIQLENMMAIEEWVSTENKIIYNNKIFNEESKKWTRNAKYPLGPKPSNQEAFEVYKSILSAEEDLKTSFVTFQVHHQSPHIAHKWLKIILKNINDNMRNLDKEQAEYSIEFLRNISNPANLEIKEAITQLLTTQIQTLMLTEASKDYVFRPISSPIVPEKKSKPSRAVICILGTFLGGIFGIFMALCSIFISKSRII